MSYRTYKGQLRVTKYQLKFMKTFNKIVEKCKSHLRSLGREFPENIAKCLHLKKSPSTLYARLSNRYMTDEIITPFYKMNEDYEVDNEEVNPKNI